MSHFRPAVARAHKLPVTAKLIVAFLASVALMVSLLTACSPAPANATHIQTTSDVKLNAVYPAPEALSEAARGSVAEIPLGSHFMLRPVELTTPDEFPAEGITLTATLPAALPDNATARFAYLDEESGLWVPTDTTVSGTTVTTTTTHLSLWTIIVSLPADIAESVVSGWNDFVQDPISTVSDAWAAWSTHGPGAWIYHTTGQLFSIQGDAPECEGDIYNHPDLEWVDKATVSQLTGIPVENQSVLRCVGVDPEDSTKLQIKAVANRGYGFSVQFASGINPSVTWSYFEDLATGDLDAFAALVSHTYLSLTSLDLMKNLLVGTTEMSFSVSEQEVRTAHASGEPLVSFVRPDEAQMALSIGTKILFDAIEDELPVSLFTVMFAMRDCVGANLPDERGNALSVGTWMLDCVRAVVDDEFLSDVDEATTAIAKNKDASFSPAITKVFGSKDARTLFGKAMNALKWLDLVILTLTMTDYWGERTDNPWWVDVAAKEIDLTPLNGTWCSLYSECVLTMSAPTVTIAAPKYASTTLYKGTYTLAPGGDFDGSDSPGCMSFTVTGPDAVKGIVHCPKDVGYTGDVMINCGCGNASVEDVRNRFSTEERLYVIVDGMGYMIAEPYGRAS